MELPALMMHGAPTTYSQPPWDDEELANIGADMGVALAFEALACFECSTCAGCVSLVEDCGHAYCRCESEGA